jgi:hypothetical protein
LSLNIIFLHSQEPKPTLRAQSSPFLSKAGNLDRQALLSHVKQVIIHASKMNALKTGSLKPLN